MYQEHNKTKNKLYNAADAQNNYNSKRSLSKDNYKLLKPSNKPMKETMKRMQLLKTNKITVLKKGQ